MDEGSTMEQGVVHLEDGELGRVFISYSRKQFYFVEALVLNLQRLGVPAWFDVQRLMPGKDWHQAIQEGLATCNGVVLIASRAALASDYVRAEWQTALAANRPIYVVLFEPVRLPFELQNASIFDCRSNFDAATGMLASSIHTGTTHRDRLPWVNPLRLPTRLSPHLWLMLSACWSQVLAFIALVILAVREAHSISSLTSPATAFVTLAMSCLCLLMGGYICYGSFGFTYRQRINYWNFRGYLLANVCFLFLLLLLPAFFEPSYGKSWSPWWPSLFVLVIVPVLLTVSAFFLSSRSQAVLRWLATGTAPEKLYPRWTPRKQMASRSQAVLRWLATRTTPEKLDAREHPHTQDVYPAASSDERVKTYRLHYDSTEEHIAAEIHAALSSDQHLVPSEEEQQADIHIAILNNKTRRVWLDQLVQSLPSLVCVVTTSIHLPADETKVRQMQWIDYRQRTTAQLTMMIFLLGGGERTEKDYPSAVVPEDLERLVVPHHVWFTSQLLMTVAAYNLAVGATALALIMLRGITHATLGVLSVAGIFIALGLFRLTDRLMSWRITFASFALRVIGISLSMPLFGTLQVFFVLFGGGFLNFLHGIMVILFPLLNVWSTSEDLLKWLPRGTRPRSPGQDDGTLALPLGKQLWGDKVIYIFVAMALMALLLSRTY